MNIPQDPDRSQHLHGRWTFMLLLAQRGHLDVLGVLYREMQDWLRAMLTRTFGAGPVRIHPGDFDDIIQDTFVKVLENIDTFDPKRGKASTWTWSICRNQALDFLRRRSRRGATSLEACPEEAAGLTADGPGPLEQLIDREETAQAREEVRQALKKLDEVLTGESKEVGQAFRMRLAGRTYAQTAAALGVPPGTVATWIHRCRKKLR